MRLRLFHLIGLLCVGILPTHQAVAQTFEPALAGWIVSSEASISSIRIDTQQHSLSGRQTAVAAENSMRALASTIVDMEVSAQLQEAVAQAESMQIGMTGLCANVSMASTAQIASSAETDVREALAQFERDWATDGGSRAEMMAGTQAIRRGVMCSASELELGLCDADAEEMTGVVPAGDTNAQPWLLRRSYGTQEAEVGAIYVDTVAPLPTITSASEASSVSELLQRADARRKMALVSMARGALLDVVVSGLEGGVE